PDEARAMLVMVHPVFPESEYSGPDTFLTCQPEGIGCQNGAVPALQRLCHVVEPNQIDPFAAAVFCGLQQIVDACESGFTSQFVGDVGDGNFLNRVHDDVAVVHSVTATHLDVEGFPDANAAGDGPDPHSGAEPLGKHHSWLSLLVPTLTDSQP